MKKINWEIILKSIVFGEIIMKKIKMKKRLVMVFSAIVLMAGILLEMPVVAQEMPREDMLIVRQGGKFGAPDLYNHFLPGHQTITGNEWAAERLVYLNVYTGEVKGWLATGFEYGPNHDTITLKLRRGVKWNDGETFDADDVVFTFNMLKDNGVKLKWGGYVSEWFEEVRAVDDYTVFIQLKEPNPRAHYEFLIGIWTPPHGPRAYLV